MTNQSAPYCFAPASILTASNPQLGLLLNFMPSPTKAAPQNGRITEQETCYNQPIRAIVKFFLRVRKGTRLMRL